MQKIFQIQKIVLAKISAFWATVRRSSEVQYKVWYNFKQENGHAAKSHVI